MIKPPHITYNLSVEALWPDKRVAHCQSHDLDDKGITIISPYNAEPGTMLRLYFKLLVHGALRPVIASAEVAYSYLAAEDDQFHLCLRFRRMHPEYHDLIEKFMREHLQR